MKIVEAISDSAMRNVINLCMDELGLHELPKIEFVDADHVGTDEQPSFGEFTDESIRVSTRNRHILDIARTLCHELVHYKQRMAGEDMDGSDGSTTENNANALAGVIMRRFGKTYPECFTF